MNGKPLNRKSYGSIPHLPKSRLGPADRSIDVGQSNILTKAVRDKHDSIIVQTKVDGSNVAIAKVDGQIVALGRAGYMAWSSPHEQHKVFARWVQAREADFHKCLNDGEWISGEWLAQAHGTKYDLYDLEPFVAFDLWVDGDRVCFQEMFDRVCLYVLVVPTLVAGNRSVSIKEALEFAKENSYGAIDPVEGAVWRCERKGKVEFLAKFVEHFKQDGKYFPQNNGGEIIWNWNELHED